MSSPDALPGAASESTEPDGTPEVAPLLSARGVARHFEVGGRRIEVLVHMQTDNPREPLRQVELGSLAHIHMDVMFYKSMFS